MYLIRNATLYAPEWKGKQDILICNDKIAAIGTGLNPGLPGVEEVDAAGKTVIPGLIDQHVHITGGGGEGGPQTRVPELNLSSAIRSGVTTLVGLLGTDGFTRSVENLVAKTKALKNEGLTVFCLTGAYQYPPVTLTGSVARDIVYIDEVIGCKLALSDHRCSHPGREELLRLVSDIRMASLVAGKPGVLHIHIGATGDGIQPLIDLVKTTDVPIWHFRPTHLGRHAEQAAAFTRMGGYADITASPKAPETMCGLVKEAVPGLLTMSSDSNGSLPVWNENYEIVGIRVASMRVLFDTVRGMVLRCGMPLDQALQFVTVNVAKALRLYPRKGTVAAGSDADLVLLGENLEIEGVFALGKPMMLGGKLLAKGTFEE